jgi:hypothetical protein
LRLGSDGEETLQDSTVEKKLKGKVTYLQKPIAIEAECKKMNGQIIFMRG